MTASICIKQANGDFYAILDENSAVKKRLVLTTVHDSQKSAQIDLYKSITKTMADAMYIGSIVVENIGRKPKGEPSIEMILSSGKDGSIAANAVDLNNPSNKYQLGISLKSFEEDEFEYPDFDADDEQDESFAAEKKDGKFLSIFSGKIFPGKFSWLVIVIIGFALILLCLGLWFFLFRSWNAGPEQTSGSPPAQSQIVKTPVPPLVE